MMLKKKMERWRIKDTVSGFKRRRHQSEYQNLLPYYLIQNLILGTLECQRGHFWQSTIFSNVVTISASVSCDKEFMLVFFADQEYHSLLYLLQKTIPDTEIPCYWDTYLPATRGCSTLQEMLMNS